MSIQMTIELSTEKPRQNGFYTAQLDLPATDMEIEDAVRRARFHNESTRRYLAIEESELFDASYLAVGTDSLHELNYLARRLDGLSDEDAVKFAAVYAARTEEFPRDAYMQVRSAINMTYGLDAVPVASNVSNNYELGKFIVENDFDERFENIPDSVLEYLDYRAIGKSFREQDGGEFIGRCYIPTRYYETQNVYDGEHLPPPSPEQSAVFSLLVAPAPESDPDEVLDLAQWLHLPASEEQMDALAEQLGVDKVQDCVFYDFKSGIPQIEKYMIRSMSNIEKLNKLAEDYLALTAEKRTMFKAVMERGYTSTLDGAIAAFKCMDNYEFDFEAENSDDFFKKYLAYHAPTNFDNRWLDGIRSEVDADRLLQRLGAAQTPYGIVSKQFGSLFALTDYFEAEKFELIEVVGQPALFSDSHISDTEVPEGLHRYDLRVGDDDFCDGAIEKNVYVNYGGSILLQQPLDLGADGYIQLDEDSSPNFTGEEMTAEKFASTDFTEYDSEDFNQTGGMRL